MLYVLMLVDTEIIDSIRMTTHFVGGSAAVSGDGDDCQE